jgi:hypothetical protein
MGGKGVKLGAAMAAVAAHFKKVTTSAVIDGLDLDLGLAPCATL